MTHAPDPNWYLEEWMGALGLKAADLSRLTGMLPPAISKLRNGEQPYKRDHVNAIASALQIEPYELLMHPSEATALRRLKSDLAQIVKTSRAT